jgi:hypothetical protein
MTQYNTSTQQVKVYDAQSIVEAVCPTLWEVDHCFSGATLEWLQSIATNEVNEFYPVRPHNRLQLKHDSADQAKLTQIGVDMIPQLNAITNYQLNFMASKFWIDLPNFGCQIHSDSKEIIVSYQVYIDMHHGKKEPVYGTRFLNVDPAIEIKLIPNHGYLNLNTDAKPHEVWGGTGTRFSVIFQYNLKQESL